MYKRIQNKIKESDIFVFNSTEGALDELNTQNLCTNAAANKLKICVPNVRFSAYPACKLTLIPFIKHVYHAISNDQDMILNYLLNENDLKFKEIVNEQYAISITENISRHKHNLNIYENALDMNEYIQNNWKKHLLFGTKNHPIGAYWTELIKKFLETLNIPFDVEKAKNIKYPSKDGVIDIQTFRFFRTLFPDIKIPTEIEKLNEATSKNIIMQPLEKYYS